MTPEKIEVKDKKSLYIKWNDGSESDIKLSNLRKNCPCAICKADAEEQSKSYIPIYSDEELTITDIEIVGQYALKFSWKDGHQTGLYEFDFLNHLSE